LSKVWWKTPRITDDQLCERPTQTQGIGLCKLEGRIADTNLIMKRSHCYTLSLPAKSCASAIWSKLLVESVCPLECCMYMYFDTLSEGVDVVYSHALVEIPPLDSKRGKRGKSLFETSSHSIWLTERSAIL
jgi:hypothetical protein